MQNQRKQAEQQARPEVEKERKQAEDEARKTLDQEAITAVSQTQKAVDAIAAGKTDEALAAIEQATGKINILLARNPTNAVIPVDLECGTHRHGTAGLPGCARYRERRVSSRR